MRKLRPQNAGLPKATPEMKQQAGIQTQIPLQGTSFASNNQILILLIGFPKQNLPSEVLALLSEWSFQMKICFRHPQSPLPTFQWLHVAARMKENRGDPEALWPNPTSCAQRMARPNELKRRSLEQRKFIPRAKQGGRTVGLCSKDGTWQFRGKSFISKIWGEVYRVCDFPLIG